MNLYPYQWEGVTFLQTHRRAYLADEMGLGKTVQAITAARFEQVENVLVVCPASVIPNWRAEFRTWWPEKRPHVISYRRLSMDRWLRRVKKRDWGLVILDEAHYCKSVSAARTKAALSVARSAARAWLLSGTPMPNDPTEFWAVVKYLWPEAAEELGVHNLNQWRNRFTIWTESRYGPRVQGVTNGGVLREMLGDFLLRRRVEDVRLDLPPLRVNLHHLEADPDWHSMVRELRKLGIHLGTDIRSLEDIPHLPPEHIATLRRFLGAYKAPRVAEQVREELDSGAYSKIVILAYHRDSIEILQRALKDLGVVGFTGSTPSSEREAAIRAFQEGDVPIFIGQQTAAGVGINLQAANEVILVEPAWTPADNSQAIKRIHRIGQDSPCRARIFTVDGTVDERIMQRLAEKSAMIEEVLTPTEEES